MVKGITDRDRPLYRRTDLARLIEPQAVAIIGVSANPGGFGSRTLANLAAFAGRVYAINPKYQNLHGVRCYAELAALPEVPDCVVIALPRESVEAAVEECAARGVGGIVIYASGYAETGLAERKAQQERLVALRPNAQNDGQVLESRAGIVLVQRLLGGPEVIERPPVHC